MPPPLSGVCGFDRLADGFDGGEGSTTGGCVEVVAFATPVPPVVPPTTSTILCRDSSMPLTVPLGALVSLLTTMPFNTKTAATSKTAVTPHSTTRRMSHPHLLHACDERSFGFPSSGNTTATPFACAGDACRSRRCIPKRVTERVQFCCTDQRAHVTTIGILTTTTTNTPACTLHLSFLVS